MPELSVVIAHVGSTQALKRCAESVRASCAGITMELIVMDAPASLVPELWSAGISRATGDVVALLTSQCTVSRNWARNLLSGFEPETVGVGGTFDLAAGSSLTDRAMFYLRYSAFVFASGGDVPNIAGDNAAYRRESLRRHAGSFRDGFWEVEFHRQVARDGGRLTMVPDAPVRIWPGLSVGPAAAQRFAHGKHFGAWRARTGAHSTIRSIASVPLVPSVLALRAARRLLPHRAHRLPFASAVIHFLFLAAAWAAGEGFGSTQALNAHQKAVRAAA